MAASGRDIKGYPYAHSISHLQCVWQNKFLKKKKQIIEGSVQKPDAVLAKIYPCYI